MPKKLASSAAVRNVQTLQIGWRILDALASVSTPMAAQSIASSAHLPRERTLAYLAGFCKLGLAEREKDGGYRLGPLALQLGLARLGIAQPVDIAAEVLQPIAKRMHLGVVTAVWGGYGPTVAKTEDFSRAIFGTGLRIGSVIKLTDPASDKFWIAFLPRKIIEHRIEAELRETARHPGNVKRETKLLLMRLQGELERLRHDGLRSIHATTVMNLNYLTAPVFDHTGQLQLVISLSGRAPALELTPDGPHARTLLACTSEISRRLGYLDAPPSQHASSRASTFTADVQAPADDSESLRPTRGRGTQWIEITGKFLEILAMAPEPMMLRELAAAAELAPGSAHPYLATLRDLGVVEQDATGLYRLGWRALQLGVAYLRGFAPYMLIESRAIALASEFNLSLVITVWGSHGPTLVRSQDSSYSATLTARPGHVFDLTSSFVGVLWAAYLPKTIVDGMMQAEWQATNAASASTPVTPAKLAREISQIRRQGLAISENLIAPGINTLGAAVLNGSGNIQVGLTLLGPASTLDCSVAGPHATALLAMTRQVSLRLGEKLTRSAH